MVARTIQSQVPSYARPSGEASERPAAGRPQWRSCGYFPAAHTRLSIANQNSRPSAILRCASARAGAPSRQPVRGTPMKAGQGARFQGPKDTRHDQHARC